MYLTFKNGKILKDLVDICKDIVTEINLEIHNEGIIMQAMDMSHVSLITFFIHKDDFSVYNSNHMKLLSSIVGICTLKRDYVRIGYYAERFRSAVA